MFAFTGSRKAFGCTQTSEGAQFNCQRSTVNDLKATAYTVARNQLVQQGMLVTGGLDKLKDFPVQTVLPVSASASWKLNVDRFLVGLVMGVGAMLVVA
jgi:hypothetical protein